jgi:hypothetical protein
LDVQPQKGAVVPLRGKQRRPVPQLVVEPHSQRIVEETHVLPVEQLVVVHGTGPHWPSVDWQR